ncbi:Dihydrofolate reductase HdrB [Frankia sp. Hr75.2]|nr:Dihydrofolate reductase HdrB [Frankia sp. Hr75.2]
MVAAAENDVIGRAGDLPWRLAADLRRFAALTRGHVVVMGRVTHESILRKIGHPLAGRHCVVVSGSGAVSSGDLGLSHSGVDAVRTLTAAAKRAQEISAGLGVPDWFVIGGARVYAELLPQVDVVDLTRVHAEFEGDARMPAGWLDGFASIASETGHDEKSGLSYTFQQLVRRT